MSAHVSVNYIVTYTGVKEGLEGKPFDFKGVMELSAFGPGHAHEKADKFLWSDVQNPDEELVHFYIVSVEQGSFNYSGFRSSL